MSRGRGSRFAGSGLEARRWIGGIRRRLDAGHRPPGAERRAPRTDPPRV